MKRSFIFAAAVLIMIAGTNMSVAQKEGTINIFDVSEGKYKEVEKIVPDKKKLRATLTKQQYHITQESGTEHPFTGELLDNKEEGVYKCIVCGTDLFLSKTKYKSGTGWPSFWEPVAKENVGEKADNSLFMRRVEVHCPRCNAHLGHLFDDGPAPTHKRYCINSAALKFEHMKEE